MQVDLFIIGGGINGTGIAADASGRGLSVALCESHDLASATSSRSSKLIHGGLRYLEHYEFSLVRKALAEREVLLTKAPHIIRPMEFVLPHDKHLRPVWMLRVGLFLYDHLTRLKRLKKSTKINLRKTLQGKPLKEKFKVGFTYSDCWVDDARLVVLNAKHAQENGATILVRTECIKASRENDQWRITLRNRDTQQESTVYAKAIVNAAGPWVCSALNSVIHSHSKHAVKLVKGSHIVVPKLYEGDHAYILQNADNRIVFAIPYEHQFTLIGTTDLKFEGDPRTIKIDESEKQYLCALINEYFKQAISPADIVWDYAGVRPLYDDHAANVSQITRDYRLDVEDVEGKTPVLSVFGGKVTTYRKLAEHALESLRPYFPSMKPEWTATVPLPGGNITEATFEKFFENFSKQYSWLPSSLALRYARLYGTRAADFLNTATGLSDLGEDFGAGLYEKEVRYLIENEWARSAEDILWRRTKLGLHFTPAQTVRLQQFIDTLT